MFGRRSGCLFYFARSGLSAGKGAMFNSCNPGKPLQPNRLNRIEKPYSAAIRGLVKRPDPVTQPDFSL